MKTAVFEYGKQSLAEWIKQNHDCQKMVLVGELCCNLWDNNFIFPEEGKEGVYRYHREPNIGWHSFDLLYGFDAIAKGFRPVEYDITDLHLLDRDGIVNDDDLPFEADEEQPSLVFKMLANRKYGTRFVLNNGFLTTLDRKVLVHCDVLSETVIIPEGTETIGRLAFSAIIKPEYKVILPEGLANIDECAFSQSDGLLHVNFPESLCSLGVGAFWGTGLTEVLLPDGVEEIPANCFEFVYIENLRLPNKLRVIGDDAFVGLECEEVHLPQSVESIGRRSLDGCYKKILIPQSIRQLPYDFYYEEGIDFHFEERKPIIEMY